MSLTLISIFIIAAVVFIKLTMQKKKFKNTIKHDVFYIQTQLDIVFFVYITEVIYLSL